MEEEEEGGGAFLTSVSLDEPALDYTTETQCATGPEPSEDGTDKDEVLVFLEAQAKRRRELQGYVASVRDQGGASGAVAVPSDFADRVATMVRTSVGKKRDFLKELRGLGERHLADQGEKEETSHKLPLSFGMRVKTSHRKKRLETICHDTLS